jgi:hypothetical protein
MAPYSTIYGGWSLSTRLASLFRGVWLALILAGGILAAPAAVQAQPLILLDAPAWAHYFCDSSEPGPDGSVAAIQGTHCYPSLTVPSGAVIQVTNLDASNVPSPDHPRGEYLVYVDGPCTIAGTISAGAQNLTWADGGGSGGGGGAASDNPGTAGYPSNGFGAANYSITVPPSTAPDLNELHVAAGGSGGAQGQNGTAGSTPTTASQKWTAITADQLVMGGSSGGSGGGGTQPGGRGGAGGGAVVLICADSISFTGTIDVGGANGNPGRTGAIPSGSGGGGGGGIVLMATPDYSSNSGTITVSGGFGGNAVSGAGAGGAGGPGWFKQFTLD